MGIGERLFGFTSGWSEPAVVAPEPVDATPRHGGVNAYGVVDLKDDLLPEFMRSGFANAAGRHVSERTALSNATFYRAVNLISSAMGMLPLNLHRREGERIEKASDHPAWRLLRVKPNSWQTPCQFKSYMQGRALLHGNAYAYKIPGARPGRFAGLAPLDPLRVKPVLSESWQLEYEYTPKRGGKRRFKAEEMFHLRAPWSSDGISGDGLLKVASETLGLASVADEAAARILRNGAYVGGVLQHPKQLSKEAILRLKAQFEERFTGPENSGRWMVAEEGMEAKVLGANGRDAEGLGQRKHQAEEVSRYTGVPRPLLMFDETSWGSGIEQLGLFFVTYCLLPWFNAWEETISAALLSEAERDTYYAKFNEAALLRGSLKDQAEFFSKALGGPGAAGFMVPDEAREKMDMNPLEGGAGQMPAWNTQENTDG